MCSTALLRTEQVLNGLRAKSISSARTVGYFSIATAVIFAGYGLFEAVAGIGRVAGFLLPSALVFGVMGVVYLRIAKSKER
jgi:hypothetical protein